MQHLLPFTPQKRYICHLTYMFMTSAGYLRSETRRLACKLHAYSCTWWHLLWRYWVDRPYWSQPRCKNPISLNPFMLWMHVWRYVRIRLCFGRTRTAHEWLKRLRRYSSLKVLRPFNNSPLAFGQEYHSRTCRYKPIAKSSANCYP